MFENLIYHDLINPFANSYVGSHKRCYKIQYRYMTLYNGKVYTVFYQSNYDTMEKIIYRIHTR